MMMSVKVSFIGVFLLVAITSVYTQTAASTTPEAFCGRFNGSDCEPCINARGNLTNTGGVFVGQVICYYCAADLTCKHFTENTVFPFNGLPCPNLEYNVGFCALTALVIAILIALALVIVVVMTCCVCCCCCVACAQRRKRVRMVEENKYVEEKDNIRERSSERRAERKAKHDEIRRKYGLYNEEQPGNYKRLES